MAGATLATPTNLTNTLSPIANATTIPSIVASDVSVNFDRLVIVPITCFVLGLACENAVSGLVANMVRIAAESDKKKYFSTVFNIITIFNLLSIVYNSLFLAHYLLNESNCSIMDFVTNIFAQSYYVIFDSFMLYKTWTVSGYNKVFFFIMCIAILNRICWGCVDLKVSSGSWRNHHCEFRQNPITGAG
ncbi:hypothetical protein BC830DRAFT_188667 [Chytriomyces sp. MP71]|nr:hypothetical protein BC830DRAFT_188667 [Chytriomyces sp. MP71]